jgi:DHA2 family multidrug resistance protein
LSVIAYSQLKPEENNKASSLTNFFRNWGGSFGIAFVNTVSERRLSFHQERVGSNLPFSSGAIQQQVQQAAAFLEQRGFSHANAMSAATAHFYNQLQAQAHLLGFMDCFHLIGVMTLLAAPLVLLTRSFKVGGGSSGGH